MGTLIIKRYSGMFWCLNDAQLVLRSPQCAEKVSLTPLNYHQSEPLIQDTMAILSYSDLRMFFSLLLSAVSEPV